MGATRDDRIVVGVDGSDPGRQALMWALDEARRRGVGCLLVHVYEFGLAAASPYAGRAFAQIRDSAQRMLDEDVAFARESGVPVEGQLVSGPPGTVLVEASRDAAMLVVGSHGRGGLAGMVLGSVSTNCVHHARCPLVVIRPGVLDRDVSPTAPAGHAAAG
jgi:nucleotide-binding universal stress UspA family protein